MQKNDKIQLEFYENHPNGGVDNELEEEARGGETS